MKKEIKNRNSRETFRKNYKTKFKLFWDTPLTDLNNTIHFTSNAERNHFFWDENHYDYAEEEFTNYNFVKSRNKIRFNIDYVVTNGLNYLSFYSEFDEMYYYAFIMQIDYINHEVCEITFMIDTIMTFTQGQVLNDLENVNVQRQHLSRNAYNLYLPMLRNNDDVLKTNSKMYKRNRFKSFGSNYVLFESSADLTANFGTTDDPKLKSSTGSRYDNITGATTLYIVNYSRWTLFLQYMRSYPWITQNFNKIRMIPYNFIDKNDLEEIKLYDSNLTGVYTLKKDAVSQKPDLSLLNYSFSELQDIVTGNDSQDKNKHLVRNEYLTIELYDMQGNALFLDSGKIDEDTGLQLESLSIIGYDNDIKVYPKNYNKHSNSSSTGTEHGAFLTQSLSFNTFVELPLMINTGELTKANQANQRNLQESRLVSNRTKDFFNGGDKITDKLSDAINVGVSVSKGQLWGKMNDEYNFYEQQKADYKDMALQPPTITSSSMGNAFLIANDLNGITIKISAPNGQEMLNVKKFYDTFGFQTDFYNTSIDGIRSMTIMNYLQITGNYLIPEIPIHLLSQLKATLEMGVKFWHNNDTANPFTQDLTNNDFRL